MLIILLIILCSTWYFVYCINYNNQNNMSLFKEIYCMNYVSILILSILILMYNIYIKFAGFFINEDIESYLLFAFFLYGFCTHKEEWDCKIE